MRVVVSDEIVEVRLSRWQKILGLMGDISVPRSLVSRVEVVERPLREVMRMGLKVGLRLPLLCYVGRTIKLDQAFVVTRSTPALSFAIDGEGPLERVLVSTPEAAELARRLSV